jgi:dihydroflavonol-4-reductase
VSSPSNLVTGATGILGSHVVLRLLKKGQQVVAMRRKASDADKVKKLFDYYSESPLYNKIVWIEGDVLDIFSIEDALEGVDTVYHCAGFVSFSSSDRKKLFAVNETGTRNVVNACLHRGGIALCHVSSIGTINNSDNIQTLDESVFWKTSGRESDYAISKYNGEREAWRGMQEGLNAVIVNPGVIVSPVYWEQSSGRIFDRCYRGNSFYTPGTSAYISAADAANAMVMLMDRKVYGNRFILVENNYSFREIFSVIQSQFGRPLPRIEIGKRSLRIASVFERILHFFTRKDRILTKPLIKAALNTQNYSNEKVKNTLGIEFEPVDKVLKNICEYYVLTRVGRRSTI